MTNAIVADGQDAPVCAVLGDRYLYWANEGIKEVQAWPLAGGDPQPWIGYGPSFGDGLVFAHGELFALSGHRVIARREDERAPRVVVDLVAAGVASEHAFEGLAALAHDGHALYATAPDGERPGRGRLLRIRGAAVEILCDRLVEPGRVVCLGDAVFVVCGGTALAQLSKAGGKPKIIATGQRIRDLTTDGHAIYWLGGGMSAVLHRRGPRGTPESLGEGPGMMAQALVVDGERVFYGMEDGVRWLDVRSKAVHVLATEGAPVGSLALGQDRLFWTVRGSPTGGRVVGASLDR